MVIRVFILIFSLLMSLHLLIIPGIDDMPGTMQKVSSAPCGPQMSMLMTCSYPYAKIPSLREVSTPVWPQTPCSSLGCSVLGLWTWWSMVSKLGLSEDGSPKGGTTPRFCVLQKNWCLSIKVSVGSLLLNNLLERVKENDMEKPPPPRFTP